MHKKILMAQLLIAFLLEFMLWKGNFNIFILYKTLLFCNAFNVALDIWLIIKTFAVSLANNLAETH